MATRPIVRRCPGQAGAAHAEARGANEVGNGDDVVGVYESSVHGTSVTGNTSATSGASDLKTMKLRANSITTSARWFSPRVRIETIPHDGRERDSRTAVTSLSAQSVSPAYPPAR